MAQKSNVLKQFIKQKTLPTDYYNIVRQTIILPVIWVLSRYLKIHALHGGTVQINGSALSFSGLSGIGKSILSLFCCLDKKNKFLSDNYLLFDENYIYPFPEWIRIFNARAYKKEKVKKIKLKKAN